MQIDLQLEAAEFGDLRQTLLEASKKRPMERFVLVSVALWVVWQRRRLVCLVTPWPSRICLHGDKKGKNIIPTNWSK